MLEDLQRLRVDAEEERQGDGHQYDAAGAGPS